MFYADPEILAGIKSTENDDFFYDHDRHISLLDFKRYNKNKTLSYDDFFIDVPVLEGGRFEYKKERFHKHSTNSGLVEIDSLIGAIHLSDVDQLVPYEDVNVSLAFSSASNIWWDEINYSENRNGSLNYSEIPKNNRSYAYRITPRLNSFMRDLKQIVSQLGGKIVLDECDNRYVTPEGILLDGDIIYQEDLQSGRFNLEEIDRELS